MKSSEQNTTINTNTTVGANTECSTNAINTSANKAVLQTIIVSIPHYYLINLYIMTIKYHTNNHYIYFEE